MKITASDARERLENLKMSVESLQAFLEDTDFHQCTQQVVGAVFCLQNALNALPKKAGA